MRKQKQLLLVLPRNERGYWGKVSNGKTGFLRLTLPTLAGITPSDWTPIILDSRATDIDYERYAREVDLVGITAFTAEAPHAYSVADRFRKLGVPVVMGGVHVSSLPEEGLQHADSVVIGEAEAVWEQVLRDCEAGRLRPRYQADALIDMRDMAIPRRDLVNRKMYVSCFHTLQATRGCPFDCDYCAVTNIFGRQFRFRPIEDVINEIKGFNDRRFLFVDDNICGDRAYAKKLFKALAPLKKLWGAQTSINLARDPDLMSLYAAAGGEYAFIGFESFSEESLASVNKSWNKSVRFAEDVRALHDHKVNILGSLIFGLDGDDPSIFRKTNRIVKQMGLDAIEYHILTPFPGTKLFQEMEEAGRIIDRDWSRYHTSEVVIQPKNMTPQQLLDGYLWAFRDYYSIPDIARRVLRSPRGMVARLAMNLSYRKKAMRLPPPTNPPEPI